VRYDNDVSVAKLSNLKGSCWRAYDKLPLTLRRSMQQSTNDWCPLWARQKLKSLLKQGLTTDRAVQLLIEAIEIADQDEIAEFGRRLPRVFGGASPHQRAGATIQRYHGRAA
jgi:hypothetical protein